MKRCLFCLSPNGALQKYEHDGKVDWFHAACVGSWLMVNLDSVIFFYVGEEEPA